MHSWVKLREYMVLCGQNLLRARVPRRPRTAESMSGTLTTPTTLNLEYCENLSLSERVYKHEAIRIFEPPLPPALQQEVQEHH